MILEILGGASGLISVLVFALYINSQQVAGMYSNPHFLWPVIPVLVYWMLRVWIVAARGEMKEDAIEFALHDRNSWISACLLVLFFTMAALL